MNRNDMHRTNEWKKKAEKELKLSKLILSDVFNEKMN